MITTVTDPPFSTGLSRWAGTLPKHISPTAAKAYLGCSLKFYFERVACIRKNTPVALHLGKAVHAALQVFHLARWRGGDDSPETIAAAFDKAFADCSWCQFRNECMAWLPGQALPERKVA